MTIDPRNMPEMPDLAIVGPCEMYDEDLEVLGRQVIAHYGDTWVAIHNETCDALGALLGAPESPYLIPGSGTTCLDAAMMNVFTPGQTVVVADTGFFGGRLKEVAEAVRLNVVMVPVEVGAPADPSMLAAAAKQHEAAGIVLTHVDTSTGVRHPIAEVARAAHDVNSLCFVDGIASVGGEHCDVKKMDLDVVVTATQKGLETPPGLGIIALGPRARAAIEARTERPPSWYLDLLRWDWYRENWTWHPHPVTMPTPLVLALASAMKRITANGIDAWIEQRAALARKARATLADAGFPSVPREDVASNMVLCVRADDAPSIQKYLLEHGLQISNGLAPLAGTTLRIGLMGRAASDGTIDRVVDLLARARSAT